MLEHKHTDYLLKVLNTQKDIAFREFSNTDLNEQEHINEINTWYKTVVNLINKDPPISHVRSLIVIEDENNQVTRIQYEYCNDVKSISVPSIIIQSGLYDND